MNQHPFHIEYNNGLSPIHQKAINNVFDNFYYFLNYNEFVPKSVKFSLGLDAKSTFQLSTIFTENLKSKTFNHASWFKDQALIIEDGNADYIGTCFYMINSLQEYAHQEVDQLGRFKYDHSYQAKFSCVEENLVLQYFQEIALVLFKQKIPLKRSDFLLSHDIDFLNSGWKSALKKAVKQFDLPAIFKISLDKLKGKDTQQNLEEILNLEIDYNVWSIFFFLTKKGKTSVKHIQNSDYKIASDYVQKCMQKISASQHHKIGIHKAISSSSFEEENCDLNATHNRYHYLAFSIPQDFEKLSKSKIECDHSLGFSEKIGFRNSYGLAYKPFNPIEGVYYNFWEFPVTIMDSSLHYYMGKTSLEDKHNYIQNFAYKHRYSCHISVLWHNNFFEKNAYLKLLQILKIIKHDNEEFLASLNLEIDASKHKKRD